MKTVESYESYESFRESIIRLIYQNVPENIVLHEREQSVGPLVSYIYYELCSVEIKEHRFWCFRRKVRQEFLLAKIILKTDFSVKITLTDKESSTEMKKIAEIIEKKGHAPVTLVVPFAPEV